MAWVNVHFVVRTLKQGILRNFSSPFARTIIMFLNFPQVQTTLACVHNLIGFSGRISKPKKVILIIIFNITEHISN